MDDALYQGMLFEPVRLDLRTVPPEITEELTQKLRKESFFDRIADMMANTNEHKPKYEVAMINVMFVSSFAVGHFLEMRRSVRQELDNFKRTNQLTVYKNQLEASRKAFDVTVMRSVMRATRSGFRLSVYVSSVLCGTFGIQAARNKSSWFDLALAYAAVSAITKAHRGPMGMLVAGSLGGLLGMLVSAPFYHYQRVVHATYPERRLRVAAHELITYRGALAREREAEGESILAIDAKLYKEEAKSKASRIDWAAFQSGLQAVRRSVRDAIGLQDAPTVDAGRPAK